ncbi:hypothetical protein [Streptomyces sp. NPDC017991]|uniref:hypothetical protein n=1 Tax=Streptomyces sp. NPDC017991 TaxID=3365026 RepID=UPI0037A3C289
MNWTCWTPGNVTASWRSGTTPTTTPPLLPPLRTWPEVFAEQVRQRPDEIAPAFEDTRPN